MQSIELLKCLLYLHCKSYKSSDRTRSAADVRGRREGGREGEEGRPSRIFLDGFLNKGLQQEESNNVITASDLTGQIFR